MRSASILVFCLLLCVPRVPAATYYFATNGSDAADGLSWETAKKDLQGFVQELTDSVNTVYVGAGEWQMTNQYFAIPKNQTLIGTNRQSVLRGTGTNPVIYIVNQTNIWLEGFTITGGSNTYVQYSEGGGIVGGSVGNLITSQFVTNCLIVSNYAASYGGGVRRITMAGCELAFNVSGASGGGAYYGYGTDVISRNNSALGNFGGGAYRCFGSDWRIENNYAFHRGGGIAYGELVNSTIVSNVARLSGGGISEGFSSTGGLYVAHNRAGNYGGIAAGTFSNCVVIYNSATNATGNGGGGMFDSYGCSVISNSAPTHSGGLAGGNHFGTLIYGNTAGTYAGGAIGGTFHSCVFVSNVAGSTVAALNLGAASAWAYNCNILWHTNNLPAVRLVNGGILANSIVFGNASNVVALAGTPPGVNTNNYFDDPQFVSGTYRLLPDSPLIDAGNNTYAGGDLDFYGRPRTLNGIVDVGAVEFDPELDVPVSDRRSFFWSLLF